MWEWVGGWQMEECEVNSQRVREGERGEKRSPIPRHGQAPLACIVIDLQRCRHAHAAHCPPPTAQPPTTPLHRTHNAWEPHWNQHLISTLNQPDNFKQRTREEAIYAALHSATAVPRSRTLVQRPQRPHFHKKVPIPRPHLSASRQAASTPNFQPSLVRFDIDITRHRPSDCRHLSRRQLFG